MKTPACLILFFVLALTAAPVWAQVKTGAPASAQPKAAAPLPRVLILGDNVYDNVSRTVVTELKGKADIVYARWEPASIASSATALAQFDRLLEHLDKDGKPLPAEKRPTWALIHVNLGLGDLIHRAENIKSFRVMPIHAGGVINTPADQYEANLDQLIRRLQEPRAKIIWASTTPIRSSRNDIFKPGSEVAYNAIAAKAMARHGVPVNDMHAYAKRHMNMEKPASHGADPFDFDKAPLHEPVTDVIVEALRLDFHRAVKPQQGDAGRD